MLWDMEKLHLLIIFSTLFVGGLITVILYGFLIYKWTQARIGLNAILLTSVFYQSIYSIFGIMHAGYSIGTLVSSFELNEAVMFWTAMPLYALRMVLPVSSVFLAVDRLCAMRSPVKYQFSVQKKLNFIAPLTTTTVLLVNFGIYLMKRQTSPASLYIFGHYVQSPVIYALNDVYNGLCIANIVGTALFMKSFFDFVKTQHKSRVMSAQRYKNVQTTNLMVLYQLLVEFVFEVIPSIATSIAMYAGKANWPQKIGPYVLALQVIYTAICSITYAWKLRVCRSRQIGVMFSSSGQVVHSTSSQRRSINQSV